MKAIDAQLHQNLPSLMETLLEGFQNLHNEHFAILLMIRPESSEGIHIASNLNNDSIRFFADYLKEKIDILEARQATKQ